MAYEKKEGDIAVFVNKNKKSEKHPDWTGKLLWKGEELQVSLWSKTDTMLAGKVSEPYQKGQDAHNQAKSNGYQKQAAYNAYKPDDDMSDDLPF